MVRFDARSPSPCSRKNVLRKRPQGSRNDVAIAPPSACHSSANVFSCAGVGNFQDSSIMHTSKSRATMVCASRVAPPGRYMAISWVPYFSSTAPPRIPLLQLQDFRGGVASVWRPAFAKRAQNDVPPAL
jgi:hypothetical protein